MSEFEPGSANPDSDVGPAHAASESPRRRILIKLGSSVAPVVLTLGSRPVQAWQCASTSAWGSAQINPAASTQARAATQARADDAWTRAEWIANQVHGALGQPWPKVGCTTPKQIDAYSMKDLYSASGGMPSGLKNNDKVLEKLKNSSTTTFQQYMLVARLNANARPSVQACLTSGTDQLVLMGTGSYSPPNMPGVIWRQSEIMQYLSANKIVVM